MPKLKIYLKPSVLILEVSLDDIGDRHISVGKSELCDISLAKFADQLSGVEDTHFVIFGQGDLWSFASPHKSNPPTDSDGKAVCQGEIRTGIMFGNCRLEIEQDPSDSPYSITFMKNGNSIQNSSNPVN